MSALSFSADAAAGAAAAPARKRGRPCLSSQWLTLDEVAEILRSDAEVIGRLLDRVPGTLPGCIKDADGWKVPVKGLRAVLGAPTGPLPQMATVAEVAEAMRRSEKTIYGWLKVMRPPLRAGEPGRPLLPHRKVLGSILIEAAAVLSLPAVMPGPRAAFFAEKEAARCA